MTRRKAPSTSTSTALIAALVVAIATASGLGGCASLFSLKDNPEPSMSAGAKKDGLIKPRIADTAASGSETPSERKTRNVSDEFDPAKGSTNPPSRVSSTVSDNTRTVASAPSPSTSAGLPDKEPPRRREIVSGGDRSPGGKDSDSLAHPGITETKRAGKPDTQPAASSGPQFKKHNASMYEKKVRRRALEVLNKTRSSFYARLCKDQISEEWTLTIYEKSRRRFWFVKHVWDHIDERWEKSFKSQKQPLARFKRHVKFASAGKECVTVKGRIPQ